MIFPLQPNELQESVGFLKRKWSEGKLPASCQICETLLSTIMLLDSGIKLNCFWRGMSPDRVMHWPSIRSGPWSRSVSDKQNKTSEYELDLAMNQLKSCRMSFKPSIATYAIFRHRRWGEFCCRAISDHTVSSRVDVTPSIAIRNYQAIIKSDLWSLRQPTRRQAELFPVSMPGR